MAVSTKIALKVEAAQSFTLDQGTTKALHLTEEALSWPSGTGSGLADEVWSDSRTVNSGADDNLELDNLSQLDSGGNTLRTVQFDKVKLVFIRNTSATDSITIGGGSTGAGAADAFAGTGYPFVADNDTADVSAGGGWVWFDVDGVQVTNGATDILNVHGNTSNQTYEIVIVGEAV